MQDQFLTILCRDRVPVSMFLVSGLRFLGHVESFDQYVVLLRGATLQVIFKHAISTVLPAHGIKWRDAQDGSQ